MKVTLNNIQLELLKLFASSIKNREQLEEIKNLLTDYYIHNNRDKESNI